MREAVMSQATIAPPDIKNLADLRRRLGGIPLERIWFHPAPGTATEKDVIEAEARENRLCELVDGTLVEKAMGFEESRLAAELIHLVKSYLDQHDLGICVGADGMMRIAPGLVRIPDLTFINWDRLPGRESPQEPIPDLAPDSWLSEVLSVGKHQAGDGPQGAGVLLESWRRVGLADRSQETDRPRSSRLAEKPALIRADLQRLDGGEVLPGFVVLLSDLLDRGRRPRSG